MISPPWGRNINQAAASREEAGRAHSHPTKDHQPLSSDPSLKNWEEEWREAAILRSCIIWGHETKTKLLSRQEEWGEVQRVTTGMGGAWGATASSRGSARCSPPPHRGDSPRSDRWTGGCPHPTTGTSLALLTPRLLPSGRGYATS